jgi:hypothetical protein
MHMRGTSAGTMLVAGAWVAGRKNSSCLGRAATSGWAWSRAHEVVSCLGSGILTLVCIVVGVAANWGHGGMEDYGRTPREGWFCAFH